MALIASCASAPEHLRQEAIELGFDSITIPGNVHEHIAFEKPGKLGSKRLHVYLEGDGTPWKHRRRIARDPTTRNPLMLRLMAMDPNPALYLGRPCYIGLSQNPPCNPDLWTKKRYSTEVIESMAQALRNYLAMKHFSRLVFAGHSGGGTLALLLAGQFPETSVVVSLAGNLDTDNWTRYHDYSPLEGSLNPALSPPLPASVKEIHLVGRNDPVIPPQMVLSRKDSRSGIEVRIIDGFDHACCWHRIWPSILQQIDELANSAGPSTKAPQSPPLRSGRLH